MFKRKIKLLQKPKLCKILCDFSPEEEHFVVAKLFGILKKIFEVLNLTVFLAGVTSKWSEVDYRWD